MQGKMKVDSALDALFDLLEEMNAQVWHVFIVL
jgi:hypothetical protein